MSVQECLFGSYRHVEFEGESIFDSGEWDSKDKLEICLITGSHCNGRIGSTSISPSGIDRFCGKDSCTISSHRKAKVHFLPHYWYIQAGPKSMSGFFATPKLPSAKLGVPVTGLFEARSKDPTCPIFPGLTLGKWKFLFNSWKEDLIEKPSPILIQEETFVAPTLTVISSDPTGKISPLSQILEETIALSTPVVVASEPTIEEFPTASELEEDTEPPPAEKSSIKPGDWEVVLARISKRESDLTAMKFVLSYFFKQRLSVQHDFNLLDGKLNDLNTDDKATRVERLELRTKIKDVATNAHPNAMRHLIKDSIELKMRKQDPIQYLATITINLVEAEIYALKTRLNTLDMKVEANLH